MPEASFDKKLNLPTSGSSFIKLKSKGDKIKFRIAKTPHYETLHWINDKEFELCGKFNADDPEAPCQWCDQFIEARDTGDDKYAKQIAPKTTFYYPILLLETNCGGNINKPAIFQFNAKSIHYTIKSYADEDVDVFACDWVVERTEENGNYYPVKRLGDKPLSKELQEQFELAKKLKLKSRESSSVVLDKEEEETIPPEE